MSESIRRRRLPAPVGSGGRSSRSRRPVKQRFSVKNRAKPVRILDRSLSEPNLRRRSGDGDLYDDRRRFRRPMSDYPAEESGGIAYFPQIRSEVFASSPSLSGLSSPSSPSSMNHEGYKKEAKVVIKVSVEGSPGPVRTMVKLGCNVDETIKIVVRKYCEEGRTPKLDQDAVFELHHSHFSLHCLDKAETIGETGSRSFYLRKRGADSEYPKPCVSEIVAVGPNIPSSNVIQSFIARKFRKIVRRATKIWNILVCMQ